ncbi:MAG: serine hydrolase [Alistipes sp.]|jgi:CubicO group peptidase (beta-lactamase class C family)|nr:serine hydrolase [Alistipes sp.]
MKKLISTALAAFSIFNFTLSTLPAQTVLPFGGALPRWNETNRFQAASPAEAGMDSVYLVRIVDSIVRRAIELKAFPGCQLFVARNGKVVIDASWGHHDYSRAKAVDNDHLYDLASVTKMAASTLALAWLAERHKIEPGDRLSRWYPPLRGTDKARITFREVLTHQSGFPSGVPRPWLMTRDSLLLAVRDVPLRSRIYRYSDLPFLLVPEIVREADGRDFEMLLSQEFYRPMGVGLTFNPLDKGIPLSRIVPTEDDNTWRMATVHGTVHDESAAVMGGVSGNAGLFGSARDVAAVMQMLLDGGIYNGIRYLSSVTIEQFTSRQYPAGNNRRGLGFDRPAPGNDTLPFEEAYPAPAVSQRSFGHTGFTGTIAWADPEYGIVYVLLCNRITPSRTNPAFVETRVRYSLQQAVYDAVRRFEGGE